MNISRKAHPKAPFSSIPAVANLGSAPDSADSTDVSLDVHPSVHSKAKRWLDIVGSLVGLGLTATVFIPIAIAIYLSDPGPIFFSQTRCGFRGKTFRVWKFRSMIVNADQLKHKVANQANGHIFKNDQDPRVTKVGRFLRRTSLDELPQFWNVLIGDMSLVGTRPPTLDEIKGYNKRHWQRLEVKPGITGEWQVNGRSTVSNFEQVVSLDLRYLERWSIGYDLRLILQTIQVVLHRKGAY
jgi:lipopolysaccharide/colanic/teichoic acid biosynthesis glycosyltransferase